MAQILTLEQFKNLPQDVPVYLFRADSKEELIQLLKEKYPEILKSDKVVIGDYISHKDKISLEEWGKLRKEKNIIDMIDINAIY